MRSAVERSSTATSASALRQRSVAGRQPCGSRRRPAGRAPPAHADAVAATSPTTPNVIVRLRPSASGSMSTCTTVASGPMSVPWLIVHMFRAHPQPTIRSAPRINSAVSGEANPPEMPSDHGLPWNSPLATALVASSAPQRSASVSSASRQPRPRPPRPTTKTGRSADASAAASRAAPSGSVDAAGSSGAGGGARRRPAPPPSARRAAG